MDMTEIFELTTIEKAKQIGAFLTSEFAFEQTWAPNEKAMVEKAVADSLGKQNHKYWFIENIGNIVAAAGVRENKYGSGGYEMDSDYIAVHKDYRRQGLASRLLEQIENFTVNMRTKKYPTFLTIVSQEKEELISSKSCKGSVPQI